MVETILGVQFAPLRGYRSGHYGWFWQSKLKDQNWVTFDDESLIPTYAEKFDNLRLKLTASGVNADAKFCVRMKLRNKSRSKSLQIQPDKIYFTWSREAHGAPSYETAKNEIISYFDKLKEFSEEAELGKIEPNLWEVTYVNQVPKGSLWDTPSDWYKILPKFFPNFEPGLPGISFATYEGNWHFEIEPKKGRIHVTIAKMIREGSTEPVLFLKLTARGEIGSSGDLSWVEGLDVGHRSCVELFYSLTSPQAHEEWGLQS